MKQYEIMAEGQVFYEPEFENAWEEIEKIVQENDFKELNKEEMRKFLNKHGSYTFDDWNKVSYKDFE